MRQEVAIARVLGVVLSSTAWLGSATPAAASGRPTALDDYADGRARDAFELELGWYATRDAARDLALFAPSARLKAAFSTAVELELHWAAIAIDSDGVPDETRVLGGNPVLSLHAVRRGANGYLRIGAGIAAPVVDLDPGPDLIVDLLAISSALAMRGMYDPFDFAPDTLSFVVPMRGEWRDGALVLGFDAAAALLVPTDERIDDASDLLLQGRAMLGGRAGAFVAGASLQGVWFANTGGDDAQLAVTPFVQVGAGVAFGYVKMLLNLDPPLGFLGDGAEVWGAFAGGGATF